MYLFPIQNNRAATCVICNFVWKKGYKSSYLEFDYWGGGSVCEAEGCPFFLRGELIYRAAQRRSENVT